MFPKILGKPPNHPFKDGISMIFTIHFGGKIPLFLEPTSILGLSLDIWTLGPQHLVVGGFCWNTEGFGKKHRHGNGELVISA